jgi:hypothetical protein
VITPTLEKWGKYDLLAHMQKYFKSRFEPGMSIVTTDRKSNAD